MAGGCPLTTAGRAVSEGGGRYASIVDAIGHTPLVEIPRMSPNPDVRLLAKLELNNPTGSVKDRAAKYLVEDLERRGLLGPDSIILEPTSGQHGDRAGDDRAPQGLPDRARDARQRHRRAAPAGRAVRRRDHRFAGRRGLERGDRAGQAPGRRGPALRDALPVRQPGQPAGALRDDRPGDPRGLPGDRRVRGRPRHGGDADGRGPLPARAQAGRPDRRGRAAPGRACPGPAVARRRLRARDPRPQRARREVPRLEPRRRRGAA